MFSRILCCALCACFASPALGEIITVNDGDDFDRLNIIPGRELVMNGGRVGLVNNYGGVSTINGGVTDLIKSEHNPQPEGRVPAYVTVNGYGYDQSLDNRLAVEAWGGTHVEIHGYNFRARAYGVDSHTIAPIEGWLLDGTFAKISYARYGSASNQSLTLVQHDSPFADPDGDWDFDIDDLNRIRNNFGSDGRQADGDTNFDGKIDLIDLNFVRNHFGDGYDQQGWPVEWEYSGEIPLNPGGDWFPPNNPVPEPSSLALTVLALFALAGTPSLRRYWRCYQTLQSL